MRLLVVGGGGREHALAWALRRENPSADIFCAPGNPGTETLAVNLALSPTDLDAIVEAVTERDIDLTIVGPEAPLAAGLADRLRHAGRAVFGPGAAAARIEASKAFSKDVMERAGVLTAASRTFEDAEAALAYVDAHVEPLVVKASGLAAGKGAVVCSTRKQARDTVTEMMVEERFGEAGKVVVIEDFLEGEECSVLAITDGITSRLLPVSQDHKRLGEGDTGPNTGGMGAYSPVSFVTDTLLERVEREVLRPTLETLAGDGTPYTGVLYAGLMVDSAGVPSVVEFNCRFGDPEAQVVFPLVADGLTDCLASVAGGGPPTAMRIHGGASVTTVLAARGYPARPDKGAVIDIPQDLPEEVTIFHAGTRQDGPNLVVNGGRVLNVTAVAPSFTEAQRLSREAAGRIAFDGKQYRHDIGWREAERLAAGSRELGAVQGSS